MMDWSRTRSAARYGVYNIMAWGLVLIISFPFIWMVLSAIKPSNETVAYPPTFLPSAPTLQHFKTLLFDSPFLGYFWNSFIVASSTTILVIVIATLGAYSVVRFRYPGRRLMGQLVLFTYLLPAVVLLVPLYVILYSLGLSNSLLGLIVAYTTFALPFSLWLLRAFIAGMPIDLEHAAMVDGAGRMGAFFDVVLPQALPGIISTALFAFILCWKEYLFALVFISTSDKQTLPTGVVSMLTATYNIEWDLLMAASVLITVPVVLFFSVLQKHLTAGFGAGAMKG